MPGDLEPGVGQQPGQSLAQQHVVLGDDDTGTAISHVRIIDPPPNVAGSAWGWRLAAMAACIGGPRLSSWLCGA
ncbi:hypothetical protein PSU4_41750 [Pseudonocardia sulfidoxydans NBRC 16205]|uniref:Uncharacterized protein n=1 Tax=Pseudonocardia sulfidoxydans NBRC 16205 TaxID=1223511 RepID=A0A511DK86_9PSEU|nr:hypothetical protein PSU4_41750 [Pseudonocardia sulfidoxydans NBRC 16205]